MTHWTKVFLLGAACYLVAKGTIFFILYVITKRVETKARAFKKKREAILRKRWLQNRELYRQQYQKYEQQKRVSEQMLS
ncbi:MAG: hypothetical protein ACM3UZ_08305 [Acidobacteriota bacterium]